MSLKIDAHQHFWQLGQFDYRWLDAPRLAPIRRSFLPDDLQPLLSAAGVDRCIVVQTQHNLAENDWALGLAARHECIAGVVGWVDLASPDCEEQLLRCKDQPKFVGVRHVTQDEPDDDFIIRPEVLRGLKALEKHGTPFDLLVYPRQLRHARTLAELLPGLPMVIDHLGKPHIAEGRIDDWLPAFAAAARCPNVYCKLSGMITEADWRNWKPADLQPYVARALELFGPQRCMFGSDWPVCLLAGGYDRVAAALDTALEGLTSDELDLIHGGTAAHFYRITAAIPAE
jgi:L-fuconolactonase